MISASITGFSQSKKKLEIEKLERQRFEAMTKRDAAFLEDVLSEQLAYTHSNGLVEDKQLHLENIRTGKLQYRSMQPEEMKVSLHRHTAVVTGIVGVTGVLNEKEFALRLRYTDVYVKEKGKWRLAAWQSLKL